MPTIDDSVVRLSLDDSQFDKASDRTIKKLDELKESLQFAGAVEGFNEIEKAVKKTDFAPMEKGVQAVSTQFNALYTIADATLRRVINNGLDTVERTIKGLTIDNVTAGWSKYADKTSAVQTIMAATAKDFSDTGVQMEYVESQLEKLNWFTDETSYAFLDMVNNIGKFTSNQIALDDAVTAMQGISNWAAISGAGIQGASRAMYNLAQAIGVGAVKLIDWKSIENANMATAEFKEMALQAAAAKGTIIDLGNGIYQTLGDKGKMVSIKNFSENLSEGWFTSEVLMDTLSMYGKFTDELYKFAEATDMSATPLIRYINEYKKGTLDLEEAVQATGMSAKTLTDWLEKLGQEEYDLGRRAFAAAQEAKTFQEAIDATKEAVASGWMQSFEYIFGNYEEAKELWSELAEGLYEVFVESGNMRNGLLRDWKALNGRTYLIDGLRSLFSKLANGVAFVKETFEDIFPPKTAEELVYMTEGFKDLMDNLQPSENTIESIRNVLTLLFTALQKVGQVAAVTVAGLEPIWELIGQIAGGILGLIGDIAGFLGFKLDEIFSTDALINFYTILYTISSAIASLVRGSFSGLFMLSTKLIQFGKDIWQTFQASGGGIEGFIQAIIVNFKALFERIKSGESVISDIFNILVSGVKTAGGVIAIVLGTIGSGFKNLLDIVITGVKSLYESFKDGDLDDNPIVKFITNLVDNIDASALSSALATAANAILDFFAKIFGVVADVDTLTNNISISLRWVLDQLTILWDWFVKELERLGLKDVAEITFIIMLDKLINTFDKVAKSANKVVQNFATVGASLSGMFSSIGSFFDNIAGSGATQIASVIKQLSSLASNTQYLQLAVAIGALANCILELGNIPTDKLGQAVASIGIILGMFTLFEKEMKKNATGGANPNPATMIDAIAKMVISMSALTIGLKLLAKGFSGTDSNGNFDWGIFAANISSMILAIAAMGALMAEMAGFVFLIKKINPGREFVRASEGMKAMATGVLMLSVSVSFLSFIPFTKLMGGMLAVAGLLVSAGAAAALMGKVNVGSVLAATASMTLMAIAITEFLLPMFVLVELLKANEKLVFESFIIIAGLLNVMAAIGVLISGFSKGFASAATLVAAGVAMISFATSVTIMAAAIKAFMDVSPEQFVKGIALIIVTMAGFAVIAIICKAAAVGLLALAAVFIAVAATFAIFAIAIKTVVDAAAELAVIGAMFVVLGEQIGDEFPSKLKSAMDNLRIILREILYVIASLAGDIAATVFTLILSIGNAFILASPWILETIMVILTGIAEVVVAYGPTLLDALERMIRGLTPGIPSLLRAIGEFVEELFAGIGDILYHALMGVFRALAYSVFGREQADILAENGKTAMIWVGENLVDGFWKGIVGKQDDVNDAAEKLGNDAIDSVADGAGVQSPSWKAEQIGLFIGEGLINGLLDKFNKIFNLGYEAGDAVIEGMKDGAGVQSPSWKAANIGEFIGSGFMNKISDILPNFEESGFATMEQYFQGMFVGAREGGEGLKNILDSILQMVGVKVNAAKAKMSELDQMRDSMEDSPENRKKALAEFEDYKKENVKAAKDTGFDIGEALGTSFDDGLSKSLGKKSGGGASKAAEKVKTAAEQIIESYEEALKELDYLDKKYKAEFNLFEALNPDLTELEKNTNKLEYINKQIEVQTKRTQIAQEKYEKIAKAMGKTSQEARDAEVEWLEQQLTLAELQNETIETQNNIIEISAKQLELNHKNAELTYNLWVSSNANASKMEQQEKKLAYTMQKLEYTETQVAKATEKYNEALEKYGEEANETKEAMNDLLQIQKDYADISQEVIEDQEAIVELQRQQAELALDNKTLEYELWLETNKQASQAEKEAKKNEEIMRRHEKNLQDLAEATEKYKEALERYGEDSIEAAEAYKEMLEADKKRLETQTELVDEEKNHLDYLTEELSILTQRYDLETQYWEVTNESATETERLARKKTDTIRKQVIAEQELLILEEAYEKLLKEEGKDSQNVAKAYQDVLSKKIEIVGYVNEIKDYAMQALEIEMKELEFEEKRLQVSDEMWQASNAHANDAEKSAQNVKKINQQMVISMKELNVLAEQYNKQIERYGKNSEQARAAWESYMNKQKDLLELQNERKEAEMRIIENELEMMSIMESRAKSEQSLWEALNQDADDSASKSRKLTYQMQSLEYATEKLKNASKKYNYALKMYGEDAKETQQLFNDMLDAQVEYANTYNELKSIQQEIITKNNDILEQLSYSEKLLDYGYNMWEKLNGDISDAQKIEAEIKKLNQDITLQVQRANYYGAEWKKAVSKYGQNSAEAQEAYLNYLEALYKALDLQSSLEQKESSLTDLRTENAKKLQDAWDEVKAKDLVGGTSIYDELVEMGLSEKEIEDYVKEKAGIIEDTIGTEMDFSIENMQKKAEDALREWGLTWIDGTYNVADEVVTTAGDCMGEMTDIIAEGAAEGQAVAEQAMQEIADLLEEGAEDAVDITEDGMEDIANAIEGNADEITSAMDGVIDEALWWAANGKSSELIEVGHQLVYGIGQGISINKWSVIDRIIEVVEEAIWWANYTAQIHSPSRRTMWSGEMLDAGYVLGIENRAGEVAKAMAAVVQNGIEAMNKVVHTSNTLDFVAGMIADGIVGGIEGYSYNIVAVGNEVLQSLSDEYDEMVDDLIGENQWLIDALRDYGFDETTHGIEFVVNLDATNARTELEKLFDAREADLEYYDDLVDMKERNAEKDQDDLAVKAEAQAINRELNRVLRSIESYEQQIENIVRQGRASSYEESIAGKKTEFIQNIYSEKPLSSLDIYRNTNSLLQRFSAWRS